MCFLRQVLNIVSYWHLSLVYSKSDRALTLWCFMQPIFLLFSVPKGTRVPLGDFLRKRVTFWSPFFPKVPFFEKRSDFWGKKYWYWYVTLVNSEERYKVDLYKKMMNIMKMEKIWIKKNWTCFVGKLRKRVPLLGVFGSPFSPLFLQKGSPKVPLRGPERVP